MSKLNDQPAVKRNRSRALQTDDLEAVTADLDVLDRNIPNAYPPSIQAGIPKLGKTPEGWQRMALGSLLKRIERPATLMDTHSYQLVTAKRNRGGIVAREVLRGDQIRTKTQFFVAEGDFLISNRQISHGACGVVPKSLSGAVVSNEYTALHPSDLLDPKFLEILSHSLYFQQTCFHSSVGVTVEKLVFRLDTWMEWKFDIPPIVEQRRIVNLLSAWKDAIDHTDRLIAASRIRRASLMLRLFGPGQVAPEQVLPEGWDRATVGQLCHFANGLWAGEEPPFINVGVIRNTNFGEDGELNNSEIAFLDVEEKQFRSRRLNVGDIILEKSGGGPDQPVGRVAFFNWADREYSFSNFTSSLRVTDAKRIDSLYLYYFLFWVYLSGLTEVMQTRSTGIRNLDTSAYKDIVVPIPPLDKQVQIGAILSAEHTIISGRLKNLQALRAQWQFLMQKLLVGELRLGKRFDSPSQARQLTHVGSET